MKENFYLKVTMTFKSLYELYIDDLSHRLREHTIINKKYIIEMKILPFFKNMKLNDIILPQSLLENGKMNF